MDGGVLGTHGCATLFATWGLKWKMCCFHIARRKPAPTAENMRSYFGQKSTDLDFSTGSHEPCHHKCCIHDHMKLRGTSDSKKKLPSADSHITPKPVHENAVHVTHLLLACGLLPSADTLPSNFTTSSQVLLNICAVIMLRFSGGKRRWTVEHSSASSLFARLFEEFSVSSRGGSVASGTN